MGKSADGGSGGVMEMQDQERQDEDMAAKKRTAIPVQMDPAVPTHSPQRLIEITHPDTPVRLGPGTQYAAHMTAHLGDRLLCTDTDGWLPVIHGEGIAWIASKAVVALHGVTVTKIKTTLYAGSGTQYAPIRKIAAGRRLACARVEGWHPVLIDGLVYWVSVKYSKEVESPNGMDHQVVD